MESIIHEKIKNFPTDFSSYNELAKFYLTKKRPSLALFCFSESLRINPFQNDIFNITQTLLKYSQPIKPVILKPDACLVSVIMRTYNRLDEIRESIQSVLSQTIDDFELIVINDAGLEAIKDIVDSFTSDKIKYLRLPENKGQSGAFNAGLLEACGKYIAYLDDDDVYYPDHLEKLTSFLESNPYYDCVYSNTWWCYGEVINGVFVEHKRELLNRRPTQFDKSLLLKANYITTLSLVFKRTCLKKAGLFNEDLRNVEDKEHFLRLASHFNFFQIDDITGEYRWKSNNTSNDDIKMWFMGDLIFKYYHYKYISIIKLKDALNSKEIGRMTQAFDEVLIALPQQLERHSNVQMLFETNQILLKNKVRPINIGILEKYFENNAMNCIKAILFNGNLRQLFLLTSLVFNRFFSRI